jgi:hypothetical protein
VRRQEVLEPVMKLRLRLPLCAADGSGVLVLVLVHQLETPPEEGGGALLEGVIGRPPAAGPREEDSDVHKRRISFIYSILVGP